MSLMRHILQLAIPAVLSVLTLSSLAVDASLPEDSLYRLDVPFSDQAGRTFTLADRRGCPLIVAMFYTSCRFVCPLIVDSAKGVEHALNDGERERLRFLLVSMDPARDDTAALKSVFDRRKLASGRWTFARTSDRHVRSIAALLGVRYRALSDGEFNHTSSLYLLDSEGRRIASTTSLGTTPDPGFMATVRDAIAASDACPE